jgi:L-2,4-diaminobutyric acid acetyltransferase
VPAIGSSVKLPQQSLSGVEFRKPLVSEAIQIHKLVVDSGTLDENSLYCYLLLCRDFADTCVVAVAEGEIVAFVTAYRPPDRQDVVFVWQIGVSAEFQRRGLGLELLRRLVVQPACQDCSFLEATITPSNVASLGMFQRLAGEMQAGFEVAEGFTSELFGDAGHEEELLFRMGPWK